MTAYPLSPRARPLLPQPEPHEPLGQGVAVRLENSVKPLFSNSSIEDSQTLNERIRTREAFGDARVQVRPTRLVQIEPGELSDLNQSSHRTLRILHRWMSC